MAGFARNQEVGRHEPASYRTAFLSLSLSLIAMTVRAGRGRVQRSNTMGSGPEMYRHATIFSFGLMLREFVAGCSWTIFGMLLHVRTCDF